MPSFANNPFGPPQNQGPGTQNQFGGGFGGGQQQPSGGGFGVFGGGFGGGQQQPNAGSQFNAAQNPGANRSNVPDWVQAPEPGAMASQAFTELTNPATGEKFMAPSGGYSVRQQSPAMYSSVNSTTQQDMMGGGGRGGSGMPFGDFLQRSLGGGFGGGQQQPEMMMSDMQYRPERQQPFGGQFGQPMQNPFQPQQPAFGQSPEYQGYQDQTRALQQQMNDYIKQAPMYQQMQDLNNKMQAYHQRHQQQQMQQRQFQQPSPFRRRQFQQPAGLQGLMGGRGGRGGMAQLGEYEQYVESNSGANSPSAHVRRGPTMPRADFEARKQQLMSRLQPSMSMDMPYARGFSSEFPTNFMKNGGKV
jgi:hypothetical protein